MHKLTLINPYQDKPEWFRSLSPSGKVPLLVDNGTAIYESNIILEYVSSFTENTFYPTDPLLRAKHKMLCHLADGFQLTIRKIFTTDDVETFESTISAFSNKLNQVENRLKSVEFVSSQPNSLQYFYAPVFMLAQQISDISGKVLLPNNDYLQHWKDTILEKPSFQKTMDEFYFKEMTQFFASFNSILSGFIVQPPE